MPDTSAVTDRGRKSAGPDPAVVSVADLRVNCSWRPSWPNPPPAEVLPREAATNLKEPERITMPSSECSRDSTTAGSVQMLRCCVADYSFGQLPNARFATC